MPVRFKVDPANSAIGLYTVPSVSSTDDTPLTDPLNNLSRVLWHPALRYPGVVSRMTGSINLPAGPSASPWIRRTTYTLGAHGQSGKPMLFGTLPGFGPSGTDVALFGSVPVQMTSFGGTQLDGVRWVTLGADSTNVLLYETTYRFDVGPSAIPAMTLSYTVDILDRNLEATLPNSGSTVFRSNAGHVEFVTPKGSFSTAKRYLKEVGSGGVVVPVGGHCMNRRWIGTVGPNTYNQNTWSFGHGSGNYAMSYESLAGTSFAVAAPTPRTKRLTTGGPPSATTGGVFRYNSSIGALEMLNGAGQTVFDSRDKLFRVTDVLIGDVASNVFNTPISRDWTYSLGSCNSNSDTVLGFARMDYSGGTAIDGVPATGWFVVGGTYQHVFGTGVGSSEGPTALAYYSFEATSGSVTMKEAIEMGEYKTDLGQTLQYISPKIYYELWVGTFV